MYRRAVITLSTLCLLLAASFGLFAVATSGGEHAERSQPIHHQFSKRSPSHRLPPLSQRLPYRGTDAQQRAVYRRFLYWSGADGQ